MSHNGALAITTYSLRIVSSNEGRSGEVVRLGVDPLTIGSEADCDLVLEGATVSGVHAECSLKADGIRVRDLDSTNGVFIDGRRIAAETMRPGQKLQIGDTVFEAIEQESTAPRAAAPSLDRTVYLDAVAELAPAPTVYQQAHSFVVYVSDGADPKSGQRAARVSARTAKIGRSEDCTISVDDPGISRQHAQLDLVADGFRITDLGSTNGTWINEERLERARVIEPGTSIRLGEATTIRCEVESSAAAEAVDGQVSGQQTVVVSLTPEILAAVTGKLDDEGDVEEAQSFLLTDPSYVWYVVSGGADIWATNVDDERKPRKQEHFLEITAGQCIFGCDVDSRKARSALLVEIRQESVVRKIPRARLSELSLAPGMTAAVISLVDTWVAGLSKSLVRSVGHPEDLAMILSPGEEIEIPDDTKVTATQGVVWIKVGSGEIWFVDQVYPRFSAPYAQLPLTADTWLVHRKSEFGTLKVSPLETSAALRHEEFWDDLLEFQRVVCECEFLLRGKRGVAEAARLKGRQLAIEEAERRARDDLAAIINPAGDRPLALLSEGATEPVLSASRLVCQELGLEVRKNPDAPERASLEDRVNDIALASGFRIRLVALRDDWWRRDQGPLLGHFEDNQAPVALVPSSARSYVCHDPSAGTSQRVDEKIASRLSAFAYVFYRPFPESELSVLDLVRTGTRGLAKDFRLLLLMGIAIGVFGAVTPYITGRIFDSAIPQADERLLWGFGVALLGSAFGTAMFKLTQGVATLRAQGKMEYTIQAALWDRLLNLPTRFFGKYSAGDLADRVGGIDAIQQLLSGAGINAILGSLSGLFYVGLMLTYDVILSVVAVLLTAVFVSFTSVANYLQLRVQRDEMKKRGRIAGLVLNLIGGVTKLRVAGAENHAFRVWAAQFAEQRRLSFKVGTIQNAVTTFTGVFPIIASLTLFYIMAWSMGEAAAADEATLTTGEFIAFMAAFGLFTAAMQSLADASLNMLRVVPIYERLRPIVESLPESDRTKSMTGRLKGGIKLSHVYFRYTPDGPYIINDVSLEIEPGEFVAFVGGSGCGKSTLLKLLLGFEQPERGSIFYDGFDVSQIDLRMLRRQLGVVLQVSKVLPADIYRNIVGASSRSLDEAWDAAERAGLADDIRAMPMEMHTYVSEGGGTLSGGQRQRLMIARAIVNRPKVIFLDEATSALDNRAQAIVTQSMDELDATRIVIAHRLSTIIGADRICYLEDGKIAEMGTYQELMALEGRFFKLASRQMA